MTAPRRKSAASNSRSVPRSTSRCEFSTWRQLAVRHRLLEPPEKALVAYLLNSSACSSEDGYCGVVLADRSPIRAARHVLLSACEEDIRSVLAR